jgi:hypothetical protein
MVWTWPVSKVTDPPLLANDRVAVVPTMLRLTPSAVELEPRT